MSATAPRCESCGHVADSEDAAASMRVVRRIYLQTVEGAAEPDIIECEGEERWCMSCVATYPHLPVG